METQRVQPSVDNLPPENETGEANSELLKAAEVLYCSGKATALDVLTAQADLARVDGAQVYAAADYAVARLVGEPLELESKP